LILARAEKTRRVFYQPYQTLRASQFNLNPVFFSVFINFSDESAKYNNEPIYAKS